MRIRLYTTAIGAGVLTFGLLMASVSGLPGQQKSKRPITQSPNHPIPLLSADDTRAFTRRFEKEVWPLLSRAESGCLTCHDAKATNPLRLFKDAPGAFKTLLTDGHLEAENPGSILARVTAPDKARKMPPAPFTPWTDEEVQTLRAFSNDLYDKIYAGKVRPDEIFPPALLMPYRGGLFSATGPDNTFLTYYQLRGKVKAIFGDEWRRNDRDLFNENIALFGGADFLRRFDESSKATANFLTGVEMMSRDVASQAYLARTGPFRDLPMTLPSPLAMKAPHAAYRRAIDHLFNRLLFRSPTPAERRDAFRFMQSIYRAQTALAAEDQDARFELTVRDAQGRTAIQQFTVRIGSGKLGLFQAYVDQSQRAEGATAKQKIGTTFTLKANDRAQRIEISNRGTSGNVSVVAVELHGPLLDAQEKSSKAQTPAPSETKTPEGSIQNPLVIPVTDPSVQVEGAWRLSEGGGVKSYEDDNRHKGSNTITIPLKVEKDGRYEITFVWRQGGARVGRRGGVGVNADAVPVEVYSHDPSRLAPPPPPPTPPKGEAHFVFDGSDDTRSFVELGTTFRFGEQDGVEIRNEGTRQAVAIDAVRFVPVSGGDAFTVTNDRAEGREQWVDYNPGTFSYYRKVSAKLISDGNTNKGEKRLLFRPSVSKSAWKPDEFYRVQVLYPGRDGNEQQVPVVVHAAESAPIVQARYPARAMVGGEVKVDASASYNLQRSNLTFHWKQTGGPRLALRANGPTLAFKASAITAQQAAWEGLCRALMKHPDFLFTRPRSLAFVTDPRERRRLQLVKIAQDLVARTPTETEIKRLDSGTPLGVLIDGYLNSREFQDFYFRRIRLYLESRGTVEDDEPVRLWCYVAFNDRSFKEILTADYTVDAQMKRQARPAYHGKTGLLTMKGFIRGKPGLPHFNYAGQVLEKFLGYVFEVPPAVVEMRNLITAVSTTNPNTVCYACHKVLTPLAYQRGHWTDDGDYRPRDDDGKLIDATDRHLVPSYPFKGEGMEAFAVAAQNKERFIRTMLQTHFIFFFGREMRYQTDERALYKRLWDKAHASNFAIRPILKTLLTSPEYLNGGVAVSEPKAKPRPPNPRLSRSR